MPVPATQGGKGVKRKEAVDNNNDAVAEAKGGKGSTKAKKHNVKKKQGKGVKNEDVVGNKNNVQVGVKKRGRSATKTTKPAAKKVKK